jgi:hypothetical protein
MMALRLTANGTVAGLWKHDSCAKFLSKLFQIGQQPLFLTNFFMHVPTYSCVMLPVPLRAVPMAAADPP